MRKEKANNLLRNPSTAEAVPLPLGKGGLGEALKRNGVKFMKITLDVPFYVGQKVWRAVYSYQNDRGEQTNIITDWVVVGYKLDEFGHLFCICQRVQGEREERDSSLCSE